MAKVVTDTKHYTDIANVLRTHLGTNAKFKPQEMASEVDMVHTHGYNRGYMGGRSAEYDAFWDAYQDYGNRRNYVTGFAGGGWTADTFKPKYNIIPQNNSNTMFQSSAINGNLKDILTQCGVVLDLSNVTRFQYGFSSTKFTGLGVINLSKADSRTTYVFYDSSSLVSIEKLIVSESNATFANWFDGCTALTDITIEGSISRSIDIHWSTGLTMSSLASIVGALSKTVTGQTITLPTTAKNTYDNATYPGRWDELVAEYPNWTFAYA